MFVIYMCVLFLWVVTRPAVTSWSRVLLVFKVWNSSVEPVQCFKVLTKDSTLYFEVVGVFVGFCF